MEVEEASFNTDTLSISLGLIAEKSSDETATPSRINKGSVPALIELIPRILKLATAPGSPLLDKTCNPEACPCSAWSKLGVGTASMILSFTTDIEPVVVPFLRTP